MRALFACALLLLSFVLPSPPAVAQGQLSYTVEAVPRGGILSLSVDLSFVGDATGHTRLHLPNHFSGQQGLYKNLQGLTAVSPGVTLADTDAPDIKQVSFTPGQTVHLHYEVVPDEGSRSGQPGAYFRPALQPNSFHFIGTTVWAYPARYGGPLAVTLHWNLPPGWAFCDSLGAGQTDQQFTGTLERFLETIYVVGDVRILTAQVGGKPVTVALRGKWKFSDSDFVALAARIVAAERDFWRDDDFPYYLVTLSPTERPAHAGAEGDGGGVEMTHSVALFQPPSRLLDVGLKFVLAHELFHEWNADQMRAGDAPLLWFSEGFTDYYARLLLLRAGLISLDDYARDTNALLREYAESPSRNQKGGEATDSFYSGTALAKLPYQQGALLAAHWNAAIHTASHDGHCLDDVMRDLRASAVPVSVEMIAAALRRYGVPDAAAELARVIENGETFAPDPCALGPGFSLRTAKMPQFELGFDGPATMAHQIVVGVKRGSRAFWAGLRDGQDVVSCAPFRVGNPDQRISITVRDIGTISAILLFDRESGAPVCVVDAGEVTAIRTACASAAATDALARPDATCLAILGTGEQAWQHALAVNHVRPLQRIVIWGRSQAKANASAARIEAALARPVEVAQSAAAAAQDADIICTTTSASEPILLSTDVADGTHINVVGSSYAGPVEIDGALVRRARFFPDHRDSVLAQGAEYLEAKAAGLVTEDHVLADIGAVFAGIAPGRQGAGDVTIYKSLGSIVQDLASAAYLYRRRSGSPA